MEVLFIYLWFVRSLPLKTAISIHQQQTWAIHFLSLPIIIEDPNDVSEAKLKSSGVQASPCSVPYVCVSYHCVRKFFPLWTPWVLAWESAYSSTHNPCTRWSVNVQLHAPAVLPPMKDDPFTLNRRLVRPHILIWNDRFPLPGQCSWCSDCCFTRSFYSKGIPSRRVLLYCLAVWYTGWFSR
jgi:hypothetical protein